LPDWLHLFQNFDVHGREVILPPDIYDLVRFLRRVLPVFL